MKKCLYRPLARYIGLCARPGDVLANLDPITNDVDAHLPIADRSNSADYERQKSQVRVAEPAHRAVVRLVPEPRHETPA